MDTIPIITLNDTSDNILDSNDLIHNPHARLSSRGRVVQTFDRSLLSPSPDRSRKAKNVARSCVKLKNMEEITLKKEKERERAKLEEGRRAKTQESVAAKPSPGEIPMLRVSMPRASPATTTHVTVTVTVDTAPTARTRTTL